MTPSTGYQNSGGRGNYQGARGGFRGDSTKQGGTAGSSDKFASGAKGPATADRAEAAVDPQAFCAHMNLEISQDLESERLLHPQTEPLTTWDEFTDEDSDIEPVAPVPSEEPPVFAHPEGPTPLTVPQTSCLTWYAKLTVVFLITLISILVMFPDVLSALDISIPKTVVGSVLAGASLLNTTNDPRYSLMGSVSPLLFSYLFVISLRRLLPLTYSYLEVQHLPCTKVSHLFHLPVLAVQISVTTLQMSQLHLWYHRGIHLISISNGAWIVVPIAISPIHFWILLPTIAQPVLTSQWLSKILLCRQLA